MANSFGKILGWKFGVYSIALNLICEWVNSKLIQFLFLGQLKLVLNSLGIEYNGIQRILDYQFYYCWNIILIKINYLFKELCYRPQIFTPKFSQMSWLRKNMEKFYYFFLFHHSINDYEYLPTHLEKFWDHKFEIFNIFHINLCTNGYLSIFDMILDIHIYFLWQR